MEYSKESVAAKIDHAVLKPTTTEAELLADAHMCASRGVFSICVRPCDVRLACAELKGSATMVGMVVGFPHGSNLISVKAHEAEKGIAHGARELDMVMNIGRFLSGDFELVEREISAVAETAHAAGALLKVILETCYLSPAQIADACRIAEAGGADFVKTSTGFGCAGATPEAVQIMLDTVAGRLQVKASGGIRDWKTALAYLEQGCSRLGIGSTAAVLDGSIGEEEY
jgi:deoxyribose-phosphate aldolase